MAIDDPEPPRLNLTLHPDAVVHPVHQAAKLAVELLPLCIKAIDEADLSVTPPASDGFMSLEIDTSGWSEADRQTWYRNWIIARGVHELARGVRAMLQEAYFFTNLLEKPEGKTTWGELQALLTALRTRSNKLNFPDLLGAVNVKLTEPLHFEREFLSLQAVRNCLEHRGGVVGPEDIDDGSDVLTLVLPRFKVFVERNGEEVDLGPGAHVDAGEFISMKRVVRERTYKLGEPIHFSEQNLVEAAFGCYLFSVDLGAKLPKRDAGPTAEPSND